MESQRQELGAGKALARCLANVHSRGGLSLWAFEFNSKFEFKSLK